MAGSSLVRVRTEVVLDVLVRSMHEAAAARASGSGSTRLESLGRHARAVERERFAVARERIGWLEERLASGEDPSRLPALLAAEEPLGRPEPGEAPSWRVPGPGGHVRHHLALRALEEVVPLADGDALRFKRAWMAGFFAHCVEEASAAAGAGRMAGP